jgi:quercetin dioxygenase-like cupin family protein
MTHQIKNVVKKENAVKKQFLGVNFEVLAIGKESMVTKMLFKASDFAPFHKHPNEQNGYVISGRYKLIFDNKEYIITTGDSYSIPANMEHSMEIIEPGEVIDVFTPIRQDYM